MATINPHSSSAAVTTVDIGKSTDSPGARPERSRCLRVLLIVLVAAIFLIIGAGVGTVVARRRYGIRFVIVKAHDKPMNSTEAAIDGLTQLLEPNSTMGGGLLPESNTTIGAPELPKSNTTIGAPEAFLGLNECLGFGDCFQRKVDKYVLPASDVSSGWNSAAGARHPDVTSTDARLFNNNAWTPYEFARRNSNGYITHFIDNCRICDSSIFSNSVQAFLFATARPIMWRTHQTGYEEFVAKRDPIVDPIGGYVSRNQRYVYNDAGVGAPAELVLQTFHGGSTSTSFNTRGPGWFMYYTLESPSRGKILVVVDSEPPKCCALDS